MNAQLYDPFIGTFMQPDPYMQDITNPINFNRYSYCLNNPLRFTDPTGEMAWFVGMGIGLLGNYVFSGLDNWLNHDMAFGDAFSPRNTYISTSFSVNSSGTFNNYVASSMTEYEMAGIDWSDVNASSNN